MPCARMCGSARRRIGNRDGERQLDSPRGRSFQAVRRNERPASGL